jgi:hypothetical protein
VVCFCAVFGLIHRGRAEVPEASAPALVFPRRRRCAEWGGWVELTRARLSQNLRDWAAETGHPADIAMAPRWPRPKRSPR